MWFYPLLYVPETNKYYIINSLPASGNFYHLLKTFANSLDLDKAWQYVRSDLDPIGLTKYLFKKVDFEKSQPTTKAWKITSMLKSFVWFDS